MPKGPRNQSEGALTGQRWDNMINKNNWDGLKK